MLKSSQRPYCARILNDVVCWSALLEPVAECILLNTSSPEGIIRSRMPILTLLSGLLWLVKSKILNRKKSLWTPRNRVHVPMQHSIPPL